METNPQSEVRSRPSTSSGNFRSLLVRGVNWLGDAVMTTPALQRIRERFPETHIALLTDEKLAELWHHHSCLNTVLTFNQADNPWSIARRLSSHHFEAALILPNSPRSALETWLAGIPLRVGYSAQWRNWFLNRPISYPTDRVRLRRRSVAEVKRLIRSEQPAQDGVGDARLVHQMHDYLHLAAALGADSAPMAPRLEVAAQEAHAALASCLARTQVPNAAGLFVGLNPSAAYGPAKRWPLEKFAEVTRQISQHLPNCSWLVFGGRADWDFCQRLVALGASRIINVAGKTSLRELMALLKSCRVLLTNDSGPMHVAAALGTPVVAVFGSTSPELTGPGQPGEGRHRVLRSNAPCSPCFRRTCPIDFRCMTGITVAEVVTCVLELVQANSGLDGYPAVH